MKIYFSGAVRGGNEDWDTYAQLILYLQKYGNVLTVHFKKGVFGVGKTIEMSDEEIFETYLKELKKADVVVQEVSIPSIGCGYEAAKAIELGKPVLCLYRDNSPKKLSTVISGNKKITLFTYNTLKEAFKGIDEFMKKIKTEK